MRSSRRPTLALLSLLALGALGGGSPAQAATCPNEAVREQQGASFLPDCRAYEMVSPPDKSTADIGFTAGQMRTNPAGDAFIFSASRPFADALSAPKHVTYIARRNETGWATTTLTPPQNPTGLSLLFAPEYRMYAEDLSWGITRAGDPPPVPGAPSEVLNLYARNTAGGAYSLLTPVAPAGNPLYQPFLADATDDLSHVIFESSAALTPEAPEDFVPKLYELADGQLRLAGVVGGESPPGGSVAGTGAGVSFQYTQNKTLRTMSADGSRIFFTAAPDFEGKGQIYVRENGTSTTHVSASQRTVPDPNGPQPAKFEGATDDGAYVFFTTAEQLIDEDADDSLDLYRYGVEGGALELLTEDSMPDDTSLPAGGLIEVSADGSRVYFAWANKLTSDGGEEGVHVYMWSADGELKHVLHVEASGDLALVPWSGNFTGGDEARITADGSILVMTAVARNSGVVDNDVYVFDAVTGTTKCLTCGMGLVGNSTFSQRNNGVLSWALEYDSRVLSADRSIVYFSTKRALVPADSNGKYDAYGYSLKSGSPFLVSTGESGDDSWFIDASASGDDAFFVTRERLVGADRDDNYDAYVARRGGGLLEPAPPAPPCRGEACQAPPSTPATQAPSSASLHGPGDRTERQAKQKRMQMQKQKAKKRKQTRKQGKAQRSKRSAKKSKTSQKGGRR